MKTTGNSTNSNEIIIDPMKIQKQVNENFLNFEKSSYLLESSASEEDRESEVEKQEFSEKNSNSSSSSDEILESSNSSEKSIDNEVSEKTQTNRPFKNIEKSSAEAKDDVTNNNRNAEDTTIKTRDVTINVETNDSPNEPSTDEELWRLKIPVEVMDSLTVEQANEIYAMISEKVKTIPEEEKIDWITERVRTHFGDKMPSTLMDIIVGEAFAGDTEIGMDVRPDWLDMDKFKKGQKFALDYLFAINYADLLSLLTVFSFKHGLKPLIFTNASSTPYTAFKRYLSTGRRVYHWYNSDPWTPGTDAYNDIMFVRKIHALVRKNLKNSSEEDYENKTTIKEAMCPTLEIARRDFESTCPAPAPGQCPYTVFEMCPNARLNKLNQGEMIATQFAFVGLFILHPKFFGVHYATDEELEAFCHVWRGIGYLLGIDDRFNFCRGSLEDVRSRSRDFLDYWVKPNFRTVNPEWEHMMRCVTEGLQYYFPGSTYEICLLDLTEVMNLHMPRFYSSLSYSLCIRRGIMRFGFNHLCKFAALRNSFNRRVIRAMEVANNFNEDKHNQLQERSAKTLNNYKLETEKNKPMLNQKGSWAFRYLTQTALEL